IRINNDGTVEASAVIRTGRLMNYAIATGVPEYYRGMIDKLDFLPNPPVYIKGKASVKDNKVSIDIEKAEIGKISLDKDTLDKMKPEIETFLEGGIGRTDGLDVKSLDFSNGKLNFDGSIPAVEAAVKE